MAINKKQYVERVRGRAAQLGINPDPKFIGYSLPDALDELGDQVYRSHSPLLQKDFTVAMTAGAASLAGVTDAVMTSIIIRSIKNVRGSTDTDDWHRSPTRAALKDEKTDFARVHYAIEDNTIYAMRDDGLTTPDNQNVTFNAHYSPVITSVVPELEKALIDIGVNLIKPPAQPEVKTP